jgi:hypothetical protein
MDMDIEKNKFEHEAAVLRSFQNKMRPPMEPADCVCCGKPDQTGRYDGLPVCFPCYQTGLLREWLDQQPGHESPT